MLSVVATLAATCALADPPQVVTDIGVTQSLVAAVMGDLGAPYVLVDAGGDPHHLQLRPSERRAIANADVLVWMTPALFPALERTAGLGSGARVLVLDDDHLRHDPADGADWAHPWLDPEFGSEAIARIAAELAAADPGNAATYAANAEAAKARIAEAAGKAREILAPFTEAPLVVYHDAYDAFARAFGLTIVGAVSDHEAAPPGAARLSALRDTIRERDVACLFAEPLHSPAPVARLSEDTGVPMGMLDPTGSQKEPGPDLYPAMIVALAEAVADCVR